MPRVEIEGVEKLTPRQQAALNAKLAPVFEICRKMKHKDFRKGNIVANLGSVNDVILKHQRHAEEAAQKAKRERKEQHKHKKRKK